ncbi:MAG TPA: hypothetical protein VF572_05915 [Candidatus Saccharimonadales bacterium]|jgi:hypothetical protein
MAGQKQIGWNKLVTTALLSALFVILALIYSAPPAFAQGVTYTWKNATTVTVANFDHRNTGDPANFEFVCQGSGTTFVCNPSAPQNFRCPPKLGFNNSALNGTLNFRGMRVVPQSGNVICLEDQTAQVTLAGVDKAPATLPKTGTDANTPAGQSDPELSCGTPWSSTIWYFCPLIKGLNAFVGGLDDAITSLLTVDQVKIFEKTDQEGSTGHAYHQAWQAFRSIALGIIVIAALIMIIAQGLGFALMDAYTIKKIFPRLLIAIIGIALSWELMRFLVILTNDLGIGVRQLIYFPFKDMENNMILGGGAVASMALITGTAIAALSIVGLLSFVLTAALAVLVAFLVLIVRQLVIVVLILFAPIAIACSILPNTQGIYKLWYESFTKAMFMFPIIMAFLAIGRVFAMISFTDSGAGANGAVPNEQLNGFAAYFAQSAITGTISQLVGFIAYFAPYFLIPLTFKFAGGAMRTLGGSINDTNRGAFDRLKKYRGTKVATNMHAMKEGNRYRPNTKIARGFNAITSTAASLPDAGMDPRAMRGRFKAAQAEQSYNAAQLILKGGTAFDLGSQDDRLLKATQHGVGRKGIRNYLANELPENERFQGADLDTAVATVEKMQSAGGTQAVQIAATLQRFATGTGYNDANKELDYQEAFDTINKASGGDAALAGRIVGASKGVAGQAGQLAWGGASFGSLNEGMQKTLGGGKADGEKIALNAFMGNDANSIIRARAGQVGQMTRAVSNRANLISNDPSKGAPGELGKITAQFDSFQATTNVYAAPEKQEAVVKNGVLSQEVRETVADVAATELSDPRAQIYNPRTREALAPPSAESVQFGRYTGRRGAANLNNPNMQPPETPEKK